MSATDARPGLTAGDSPTMSLSAAVVDSATLLAPAHPDSTAQGIVAEPPAATVEIAPEQIGLWGLLGILYPLLLLVGLRLLRTGSKRARTWTRRRLDRLQAWLRGAGVAADRVRILRRTADLGLRVVELSVYLLCIYLFSLYFFLLIPGTRELGLGMAQQFWPPLRATILLVLQTFTYLVYAIIVLTLTRWLVSRLRDRLGATVVRPATFRERERLLILRCVNWLLYFVAAIVVVVMLPGPGRWIGTLLIALTLFVVLIAARRTLENIAAGFTVGRIAGARCGARIRCGDCQGRVEEWTLTGLRIRDDQGFLIHLPYRACEEVALMIDDSDEGRA